MSSIGSSPKYRDRVAQADRERGDRAAQVDACQHHAPCGKADTVAECLVERLRQESEDPKAHIVDACSRCR